MTRLLARAMGCAIFGALAGAAAMILLSGLDPRFTLEMTQDRPGLLRGFYPGERDGDLTFAWTAERAEMPLAGLDRNVPWTARIRVRGGRLDPATLPILTVLADDVPVATRQTTNEFETLDATIPARTGHVRGVTLALAVSNTFVPGSADGRALGVQIDRISVAPATLGAFPPRRTVAAAALGSAVFGAIFGLLAATATTAVGAATLLAVGQAAVLRIGLGPFAPWLTRVEILAASIGISLLLIALVVERWRHEHLRHTARFALMFTGAVLYLHLLVLLHPDMPLPDGFSLDAIARSAATLPLASPIADRESVVWALTALAQGISFLVFYWLVAHGTADRLLAAVAVAILQLMPLGFHVLAQASFTAVAWQVISIVTMGLATAALLVRRRSSAWIIAAAVLGYAIVTLLWMPGLVPNRLALPVTATIMNRAPGVLDVPVACFGWPFLALAAMGLITSVRSAKQDWWLLLGGWFAATMVGLVLLGNDVRVYYAAMPPVAVLAARGVMALWMARAQLRTLAVATAALGAAVGVIGWLGLLSPAFE